MVNFIGSAPDTAALAALEGVHVHLYDKAAKPKRKVGHATVTAETAEALAERVAKLIALADAAEI